MAFFPEDEVKRKLFHLLTLGYILGYLFLPRAFVLWTMGLLTLGVIVTEFVRLRVPSINTWILNVLGGVHRPEEENKVSGLPFTFSGSFLTMLLFVDTRIVVTSLLYLAFGDTMAALIGRGLGKKKIMNGKKTFEGSLACFFVCFFLGLFSFNWQTAFMGALIATLIELAPWPLNDNFWVPLVSAASLTLLVPLF
jgi:dolichol kinase